ncbi:DNA-directed RNA polymerase III subunit rpc3 isoform X2 [Sesamum indicum]|uniref:DNA-directed RNA polymerase III subunit RPC3 n=1 Tax=Sesamum indicum TaxID=4182 RepID=A0A6I9T6S9_SESIN|nr:DNA-directed RNA polymerase III subunit rpc3 isoform X2 [Sesamum indicum]
MVSPHGVQLATHLISSFYGDLCSKVCECLLRRGTLTLAQIIRFTELSRENVINCLRVLIHQNCVQAFAIQQEGAFGEAPRIITQYMALFDNMIHKMRAPKFMQIVSEELGKDCLGIFQGLIQHGRLSINQIIDRNEQTAGSADVHVVRESFNRLLIARFIERCPAPEPFLAPPADGETPAKKRGAKSAKIGEERQTTEQRALAAAAPMDSMRFLMEMDDPSEEKSEECTNSVTVGEKRKQDVLKSDEDALDADKKKEVLWRVNFEELVRRLRHKACVSYVKMRINDEAAIVLSAMLELSRHSETRQKAENSAYLSINAIYDEVIKKEGGLGMDFERIRASLEQLGCQCLETGVDENYSIDIKGIIESAQTEEVESVVLRRYGREAYRIFRLLSKAGRFLESDKISDTTFVEKKDTIKILYKLWKDDYLHMEKLKM